MLGNYKWNQNQHGFILDDGWTKRGLDHSLPTIQG